MQVLDQPIWFNSNSKINNQVCINNRAYAAGFVKLGHIIDENGVPVSFNTVTIESQGTVNFVEYYTIFEAIDISWKRMLRNDVQISIGYSNRLEDILSCEKVQSFKIQHTIRR